MREERIEIADTVIYIEIPLLICLWNVGKDVFNIIKKSGRIWQMAVMKS